MYKLVWDDFCAWYLEIIKPAYGQAIAQATFDKAIAYFEELLKLLHPFTPFISEELWQHIAQRPTQEALIVSQQKQSETYDAAQISAFETTKAIVSGIRNYRQSKGVSPKDSVEVYTNLEAFAHQAIVQKLANVSQIHFATKTDLPSYSFLVDQFECSIPLSEKLDLAEEKSKAEEEIKYLKGFLISVDKKLGNEKFMASAPAQVVEAELKKKSDALQKITLLEDKIKSL